MNLENATAYTQLAAELRGNVNDEADTAQALQMLEVESGLSALRNQASKTVQLFAEDGQTVLCWECQAVIEAARLAALPGASFCIGCQTAIEKREKQWAR